MEFYISFASPDGFLGACVVDAEDAADALRVAKSKDCNPGGSALIMDATGGGFPEDWKNRLLSKAEAISVPPRSGG